jgi:hypothetical protein
MGRRNIPVIFLFIRRVSVPVRNKVTTQKLVSKVPSPLPHRTTRNIHNWKLKIIRSCKVLLTSFTTTELSRFVELGLKRNSIKITFGN